MERKTFILTHKRTYRRAVKLFLRTGDNQIEQRLIKFTTEHKVSEKERNRNARQIPAEYITSDERVYDGLLRSHGYGKTFILKGDPEAKLKRTPIDITSLDSRKSALRNLFDYIGLQFDGKKDVKILESEYQIHASAMTGKKIEKGAATEIPHTPVNIEQELTGQAASARAAYKEKYGEEIPEGYYNDMAFLSALSDPKFDAKAYMNKVDEDKSEDAEEESIEDLRQQYFDKFEVNVANAKKNDAAWIKNKLAE